MTCVCPGMRVTFRPSRQKGWGCRRRVRGVSPAGPQPGVLGSDSRAGCGRTSTPCRADRSKLSLGTGLWSQECYLLKGGGHQAQRAELGGEAGSLGLLNPKECFFFGLALRIPSLVAQTLRGLPVTQETSVQSLGQEDPLEKEMAARSSILAWRSQWMEEPGRLQPVGLQRVGHD